MGPQRGPQSTGPAPSLSSPRANYRPPYPATSFEGPTNSREEKADPSDKKATPSASPSSVPAEPSSGFSVRGDESVVALDTGAAANLACFQRPHRRNASMARLRIPSARPHPAREKFKFGNYRMEEVQFAADIPAVLAGRLGTIAAFLAGADIPVLFRKGAAEPLKRDWVSPEIVYASGQRVWMSPCG